MNHRHHQLGGMMSHHQSNNEGTGTSASSVTTEEFIRAESHSPVVHLDHRRITSHHLSNFKVSWKRDEMVSNPPSNYWPLSMEVATECRMQNVECSLVSASSAGAVGSSAVPGGSLSLVFSTTRPVEKGQRLYFWFSETMLAKLEMPFLVPKNIQGGDRYVCHRCGSVYVTPNPLKLHLFFRCAHGQVPLPALWSRVHHILTKSASVQNYHQHHRSSPPPLININQQTKYNQSMVSSMPASMALSILPHQQQLRHQLPPHRPSTTPAQVETLVSSLGRSKHGHVCIYCGKIYSRKYGLKIHIRTHTGYKPLKCPVCMRPFGDPSNLNKHIRLHSEHHQNGENPYKCELCGKVLVRRRDLDRHIQSRHSSSSSGQPSSCPSPAASSSDDNSSSAGHLTSSRDDEDINSDDEDELDVIDIC